MERNLAGMPEYKENTPRRQVVFNLPNQLTLLRFFLACVLFYLISTDRWLSSLVVFIVAAFTDWLDGYLARTQNMQSSLGRNLDPLVDKVLTCGAFIFLLPLGTKEGWLPPWMVTVVVARELIITGLRNYMENKGASFGADWLGKIKLGLQVASLIAIFLSLQAPLWFSPVPDFFPSARAGLIWAMLGATVLSGLQYLSKAFQTILKDTTP